jgi:hypothetical protein
MWEMMILQILIQLVAMEVVVEWKGHSHASPLHRP